MIGRRLLESGRRDLIVLVGACCVVLAVPAATSGSRAAEPVTLPARADAWVDGAARKRNHGGETSLQVGGAPARSAYLRFELAGSGRTLSRARLRLYALTGGARVSVTGARARGWSERGVTFANAPPTAGRRLYSPRVRANAWTTVDVTPLVRSGGSVTLVLRSEGTRPLRFAARERRALAPRLVVETASQAGALPQPSFPIRAAFYYPWYPETWTVNGSPVAFRPSLGRYETEARSVQQAHIRALGYAGMNAAISSWWGPAHYSDDRLGQLLRQTVALRAPLKWAVYYEPEGNQDPTADQIAAHLRHIREQLATSPAFLRVGGKYVVFVYNQNDLTCAVAEKWAAAKQRAGGDAYVVLKVFPGYRSCQAQPDGWHQYSPAKATDAQSGHSFSVSPGFWRADEAAPRLPRDLARFQAGVAAMAASKAPWQLVTTFNEWGEGTATESAAEWATASGRGAYLDALRAVLGGTDSPADVKRPSKPAGLAVTSSAADSIALAWSASTDDVGVAGYRVFRGTVEVGTTAQTSFTVTGLSCGKAYALGVVAYDAAGNSSSRAGLRATTSSCTAVKAVKVAAVGDIACDPEASGFNGGAGTSNSCRQRHVSDLVVGRGHAAVLALGDLQYENGALDKFMASFHPSFGRVKSLIRPAVGNHEYLTPGAAGYFDYFGAAAGARDRGYYSFDLGAWHLISINSNCSRVGGCDSGSPQARWLRADLAAHPTACTLAYSHHPRWSSGQHGSTKGMDAIWRILAEGGADVVLAGHDHDYERFAPLNAGGDRDDTRGIRSFVVGSGGKNHYPVGAPLAHSEVRDATTYGVLELTLRATSYAWEFVPEAGGAFRDSGSGSCH